VPQLPPALFRETHDLPRLVRTLTALELTTPPPLVQSANENLLRWFLVYAGRDHGALAAFFGTPRLGRPSRFGVVL
jgi:hypothetical protein